MRWSPLLGLALASPAAAQPQAPPTTVTVRWAHGPQDHVIIDENLWRCAGDRCSGDVVDHGNLPARACRKIHRAAGSVEQFVLPTREFTPAELQQCNR